MRPNEMAPGRLAKIEAERYEAIIGGRVARADDQTGVDQGWHFGVSTDNPLYTIVIFALGMLCACGLIWGYGWGL
jgi:hypothetical protein